MDIDQTNITEHVDDVVDFIDAALREGGKVLVNCNLGMSRSAACTCAYLIVRQKMTLNQAINQVQYSAVCWMSTQLFRFASTEWSNQMRDL